MHPMTDSNINTYCLPVGSVADFVTLPVAGLDLMPANEGRTDTAPFTALDCFDQSLRRSSRLLLDTGTAFELLTDQAPLVTQATKKRVSFVTQLADGPVRRALDKLSALRSLLPVGSGERHRAAAVFIDDEGKTHCRVNMMQLVTEQDKAVVIELHGIKGYADSVERLREHISQLGGTALNCRALYEQLFAALPAYDPKPEIFIAGDDTAFDAANKIISTHIPLLRANEFGVIADHDTEFLHDYRIHLRKIRSVLSLFKGVYDEAQTAALQQRFSTLMAPTGTLRDLDVYLLEKQRFYDLLPEGLHIGLDTLFDLLSQRRAAEQKQLSIYLESEQYQREINGLAKRFTQSKGLKPGASASLSAFEYARERIWRRYRKVSRIASGIGPHTSDVQIHELRIHCKKLRYLLEFFGPVFPKARLDKLLKALKRLQDELGLFNDYSVQQESLSAFALELSAQRLDAELELEVAQSVGALIAVLHSRQIAQRARILKKIERFNRSKTQRAFKQLFQEPQEDAT